MDRRAQCRETFRCAIPALPPREEVSLATALREGGYQTWHVGKWHLGDEDFYPERHGFDVNIGGCHYGSPTWPNGYWSPYNIPTLPDGPPGEYLTDRLTDEAIRLVQGRDRARPFFLNLWHYAVHIPILAPGALVEKYRRKAAHLGLDKIDPLVEGVVVRCCSRKAGSLIASAGACSNRIRPMRP